jgi:hypothetical protein
MHSTTTIHSILRVCVAGSEVVQVNALADQSAVVALTEGTVATATAMAAFSAANDGLEANTRAFVARLTQLDEAMKLRRERRSAGSAPVSERCFTGGRPSASGTNQSPQSFLLEDTEEVTAMVETLVNQVNLTVCPTCTTTCSFVTQLSDAASQIVSIEALFCATLFFPPYLGLIRSTR